MQSKYSHIYNLFASYLFESAFGAPTQIKLKFVFRILQTLKIITCRGFNKGKFSIIGLSGAVKLDPNCINLNPVY